MVSSNDVDWGCVYPLTPIMIWIGVAMFLTGLILLIIIIRRERKEQNEEVKKNENKGYK